MTDPGPDQLAEALRAAHRSLQVMEADPEARIRLQVRFLAICASLKLPGASRGRGLARLARLIADAEGAGTRSEPGGQK
jgi:hypothetical protein